MSVRDFELALVAHPNARYASVSETIFFELDNLGKIKVIEIQKELPKNPERYGHVYKFLRSLVERSEKPLKLTCFVLTEKPDVHVDCISVYRFHLDEIGPNSFVLC